MQVFIATIDHAKTLAKSLKSELDRSGSTTKLSRAQEAVARMLGHASWNALTKASGTPSPMAWEVGAQSTILRTKAFSERLAAALGIPADTARGIVEAIRPLAGRADKPAAEDWRHRYLSYREAQPLAGWPRTDAFDDAMAEIAEAGFDDPNAADLIRDTTITLPDGKGCRLVVGKNAIDADVEDTQGASLGPFWALLERGGRVLASIRGVRIDVPHVDLYERVLQDLHPYDCPLCEPPSTFWHISKVHEIVDPHMRRGGSKTIAITHWARNRGLTPPGTGRAMLDAVLDLADAGDFFHRVSDFALNVGPAQYVGLEPALLRGPAYRAARRSLYQYLFVRSRLRHGRDCNVTDIDLNLSPAGLTWRRGGIVAAPILWEWEDAPSRMPSFQSQATVAKGLGDVASMVPGATATRPGEPVPIYGRDKPHGFDLVGAASGLGDGEEGSANEVRPHPDLWKHMPSEVASIRIGFCAGPAAEGDLERITYAFANGTELDVGFEFLPRQRFHAFLMPDLVSPDGMQLTVNPYTDRMSVLDMWRVLTTNALLLLDPDAEPCRATHSGDVVLTRQREAGVPKAA